MKRLITVFCMLAALILMATPYGVTMHFAASPTEQVIKHFSYFSMIPWGYGNLFPILTAFLSIIALLLMITGGAKTWVKKAIFSCLSLSVVASLLSWGIFASYSAVGAGVLALHAIALLMQSLKTAP